MSEDFKKEETKRQDSKELNENELENISGGAGGSMWMPPQEEKATSSIKNPAVLIPHHVN